MFSSRDNSLPLDENSSYMLLFLSKKTYPLGLRWYTMKSILWDETRSFFKKMNRIRRNRKYLSASHIGLMLHCEMIVTFIYICVQECVCF